jgi:5-formaminoimidazole-4-carboxamide-1-(beta)-D-ribofuranosyl 5'-monophosphate synthetase
MSVDKTGQKTLYIERYIKHMVSEQKIRSILKGYDEIIIGTICSHTSLQIFDGARREGFKTLGICIGSAPKFYDAFPRGKPTEFFVIKNYSELVDRVSELIEKNVILIPHGSFVEYLGTENFENLEIPIYGNRKVLEWEYNREKQREWLLSAGLNIPKRFRRPEDIDVPAIIKYYGAKGGKGFFIVKNYNEFLKIKHRLSGGKFIIQEYVLGTRYYLHYFYSPIKTQGYRVSNGILELLSMDRRDEANIDEMYKLGAQETIKEEGIYPTFVVTGNILTVIRESLLPDVLDMGEKVVETSIRLFGGMIGPFCLETIVTDELKFKVFEISSRIVAGTNIYISGSPYSDLISDSLSTGRRIAQEIKLAINLDKLDMITS